MRTTVKVLTSVILLIICLVAIIPFFMSSDDILAQVSSLVEKQTGRSLLIDGEKKLSLFPALVLELNQVRFANLPQGSRQDMATMASMQIHLPWMSIFSRQLNIDKFVLEQPDILLEIDKAGRANWQFQPPKETAVTKPLPSPGKEETAEPQVPSGDLPAGFDLQLGQVEIIQGKITYIDHSQAAAKQTIKLDKLNLAILLPSLHQTLKINGELSYAGQTFNLASTLSTPSQAINKQAFTFSLALTSALFNLNYNGEIKDQGQDIQGTINLSGDSVKAIARWQQMPLTAQTRAFNQFSLTGKMHFNKNILRLSQVNAGLDELSVKGAADIHLTTPLDIRGDINLGVLDLTPYLPPTSNKTQGETPPVNETPAPGKPQPIIWDKTPIDLTALKMLNTDIKINSEQLKLRDITLGANRLEIAVNNQEAQLSLTEFNAYQGQGTGNIKLDASASPYKLSTQFSLSGIEAQPLLRDVIGFKQLIGSGKLDWSFISEGQSVDGFISQLNGTISTELTDGAVKGINLGALARSAKSLLAGDFDKINLDTGFNQSEKTDFAALNAKFEFTRGISTDNLLTLVNPFLRVSGQGEIDLPQTRLDYRLNTRLVNSDQGQASTGESAGFSVPVRLQGPFHQVKIKADVKNEAKEKLKQKAKDKITDKLKDLFGN
ncbi:AsmA family protein [Thalassomonas viridans]|uniref:AsmA family protein n=1 Tax=Thalassomonas viridans TaxID=137584 RepID=A0AAE9Z7R7_9GAMM|nr:AsmA family protein [Thalassomonas viridans]WDE07610.1 AsmA family protein [Thalassomonas viridans]